MEDGGAGRINNAWNGGLGPARLRAPPWETRSLGAEATSAWDAGLPVDPHEHALGRWTARDPLVLPGTVHQGLGSLSHTQPGKLEAKSSVPATARSVSC